MTGPPAGPTSCSCSNTRRSIRPAGARPAHERPADGTPVRRHRPAAAKITWHGARGQAGRLPHHPGWPSRSMWSITFGRIEESLIKVCTDVGLQVGRIDGRSGVVGAGRAGADRHAKVAAIGVRVSRATTLHGFRRQLRLRPRRVRDDPSRAVSATPAVTSILR